MKAVAFVAFLAILSQVAHVRSQDETTYSSPNDSTSTQEDSDDSSPADGNDSSDSVSEADSGAASRNLRTNVLSPLVLQGASQIWSPSERQITASAGGQSANPAASNALLNVLSSLLNPARGNLGKLPLCSLKQLTGGSGRLDPRSSQLSLQRLQSLIALLSNTQSIRPCVRFPRPCFSPQTLNPYPPFIPSQPQPFPLCDTPGLCEHTSNPGIPHGGFPNGITPVNGPVSCGEDSYIKHVPVVQKITRQVIETRTRHVPVIKKRIRTVVEPYTSHVPVLEKFARPVEDTIVRTVPVVQKFNRPCINLNPGFRPILPSQFPSAQPPQILDAPEDQQIQIGGQPRLGHAMNPCSPGCSPRSGPVQFSLPEQSSPSFSFLQPSTRQIIRPLSVNQAPQTQSLRCPSPPQVYHCSG